MYAQMFVTNAMRQVGIMGASYFIGKFCRIVGLTWFGTFQGTPVWLCKECHEKAVQLENNATKSDKEDKDKQG